VTKKPAVVIHAGGSSFRKTYLQRGLQGIKIVVMSLLKVLNIGPEGLILVWAVMVSLVVALLSWRRVGLTAASVATLAVAASLVAWEIFTLDSASFGHQLLRASFIVVPSAVILGVSRIGWLARRAWVLLLVGPIVFVGCFVGICDCAYRFFGA
jgi:hypothetical protein